MDMLVETIAIRCEDGEWYSYELLPDTEIALSNTDAIAAWTMSLNLPSPIVEIIAN